MRETKISIIIAVYNGQETIEKCLKSLLHQTFRKFVIYVIDDGSIDNTVGILKNYSDNLKVKVIQQCHLGVSAARNCGLLRVDTEYVTFIDADDYVNKDYLKDLYNNFLDNSIDMTICSWVNRNKFNKNVKFIQKDKIYTANKMLKRLFDEGNGPQGYLWNKLFKMEIILKNHLRFDENISIAEDLLFCCQYLIFSNKVRTFSKIDYNYNLSLSNASSGLSIKNGNIQSYTNYLNSLNKISKLMIGNSQDTYLEVGARICSVSCDLIRLINLKNLSTNKFFKEEIKRKAKENMTLLLKSSYIRKKKFLICFFVLYFPHIIKIWDVFRGTGTMSSYTLNNKN